LATTNIRITGITRHRIAEIIVGAADEYRPAVRRPDRPIKATAGAIVQKDFSSIVSKLENFSINNLMIFFFDFSILFNYSITKMSPALQNLVFGNIIFAFSSKANSFSSVLFGL